MQMQSRIHILVFVFVKQGVVRRHVLVSILVRSKELAVCIYADLGFDFVIETMLYTAYFGFLCWLFYHCQRLRETLL